MLIWMDGGGLAYNTITANYDYNGGAVDNSGEPRAVVDTATNGRWGGRGWYFSTKNGGPDFGFFGKTILSGAHATWGVGLGFKWMTPSTGGTSPIFSLRESSSTSHIELKWQNTGDLVITRNGTVLGTASSIMSQNVWYHLELWATCHDSAGTAQLKVNGTTVLNLSGVDTRNGGTGVFDTIEFGTKQGDALAIAPSWRINDVFVCNGAGTYNNTFLGDRRVALLTPTGVGNYSDFTKAGTTPAATNWQGVDEIPHNSDTDRNDSSTLGHIDSFATSNLPTSGVTVHGVKWYITAKRSDSGSRTLKGFQRSAGADYVTSGSIALTPTYVPQSIIQETNPATGILYTGTEVNAAEFGYKIAT